MNEKKLIDAIDKKIKDAVDPIVDKVDQKIKDAVAPVASDVASMKPTVDAIDEKIKDAVAPVKASVEALHGNMTTLQSEVTDIRCTMVTQDDLDQRLGDQSEIFVREMDRVEQNLKKEIGGVRDELGGKIERIDRRTDEEIRDVYGRLDVLG